MYSMNIMPMFIYGWSSEKQPEAADPSPVLVIGALEPIYLLSFENYDFDLVYSIHTAELEGPSWTGLELHRFEFFCIAEHHRSHSFTLIEGAPLEVALITGLSDASSNINKISFSSKPEHPDAIALQSITAQNAKQLISLKFFPEG